MTLEELIQKLEQLKAENCGNLPVLIASDSEGNQYGKITEFSFSAYSDSVIIYPTGEYMTPEDALED